MENGNTALAVSRSEGLATANPMAEWEAMRQQAKALVMSGFLPKAVNTPEKAIAIMQTGKELGIGPMQALRTIHIIEGKPAMAAELIAGLVLSRIKGAILEPTKSTDTECIVVAQRPGGKPREFKFTIEDAKRAGLVGKQNWKGYPRAMLRSRAITEAARAMFPDATMGMYDPDELGAVTSETGEVIQMPVQVQQVKTEEHTVMFLELSTQISGAETLAELEALIPDLQEARDKKLVSPREYGDLRTQYGEAVRLMSAQDEGSEEAEEVIE
jgi:hypothetical protein